MFPKIILPALLLTAVTGLQSAANNGPFPVESITSKVGPIIGKTKQVIYSVSGKEVGHIFYGPSGTGESFAKIQRLEIFKEGLRGKGLGSHMLGQALQDLKNDGYAEVRLEAHPFLAPIKDRRQALEKLIIFYEKNGFKVLGTSFVGTVMQKML